MTGSPAIVYLLLALTLKIFGLEKLQRSSWAREHARPEQTGSRVVTDGGRPWYYNPGIAGLRHAQIKVDLQQPTYALSIYLTPIPAQPQCSHPSPPSSLPDLPTSKNQTSPSTPNPSLPRALEQVPPASPKNAQYAPKNLNTLAHAVLLVLAL